MRRSQIYVVLFYVSDIPACKHSFMRIKSSLNTIEFLFKKSFFNIKRYICFGQKETYIHLLLVLLRVTGVTYKKSDQIWRNNLIITRPLGRYIVYVRATTWLYVCASLLFIKLFVYFLNLLWWWTFSLHTIQGQLKPIWKKRINFQVRLKEMMVLDFRNEHLENIV